MLQNNLQRILRQVRETIPEYPIEVILSFMFGLLISLATNDVIDNKYLMPVFYIGLSVFISYVINVWCIEHQKLKSIYIIGSIIVAIGLPVLGYFFPEERYCLTAYVITVLSYFLTGTDRSNAMIVSRAVKLAKSVFISGSLLLVIVTLLWLIILSISNLLIPIDVKDSSYLYTIIGSVSFILLLIYSNKQECDFNSNVYKVLVHYILTTSLIIYTIILYLYIAKIIIRWELPEGNLGYITIMYISLLFMTRAISAQMTKLFLPGFFLYAPLISIVPLVLLWISAVVRISEHGLTIPRVYLIVVALIETVIVFVSFNRKSQWFKLVISISLFLIFAVTYLPYVNAESLSEYSQKFRSDEAGNEYVEEKEETCYIKSDSDISVEGYSKVRLLNYPYKLKIGNVDISLCDDILQIKEHGKEPFSENLVNLFASKLDRIGYSSLTELSENQKNELLTINRDPFLFVFSEVSLQVKGDSLVSVSFSSPVAIFSK